VAGAVLILITAILVLAFTLGTPVNRIALTFS
jgi:fructose-specific phosphotransferase system IIC component